MRHPVRRALIAAARKPALRRQCRLEDELRESSEPACSDARLSIQVRQAAG